jgi:hypothetical protein
MTGRMNTKNILYLFIIFFNVTIVKAQDKGRWIIVSNYPKAITYVDTLKFTDFDTRAYHVGKYKVKAWRAGGVLVDTSITVRKDSISYLKLKIKDTPAYADYKSDLLSYRIKRWTPKVVSVLSAISLQVLYMNSKNKADKLEETYKDYKEQYDNLYNTQALDLLKYNSDLTYKEYLKEVKKQNRYSMMRLIVPAIVATTIVIDLSNKKPTPYVEVPLLTMYNPTYNMSMEGNAGLNLICKF